MRDWQFLGDVRGRQMTVSSADVGLHQINPDDLFIVFRYTFSVILENIQITHILGSF